MRMFALQSEVVKGSGSAHRKLRLCARVDGLKGRLARVHMAASPWVGRRMRARRSISTPSTCVPGARGMGGTAVRGVPGDVGRRARGAELTKRVPRLCAQENKGIGADEGARVFVNVIVTTKWYSLSSPLRKAWPIV